MRNKHKLFLITGLVLLMMGSSVLAGFNQPFFLKDGHTIVDQSGRIIRVTKPFTRIISLYSAHTENLLNMGLDAEIIGVTRLDRSTGLAEDKKHFSYHDGPERFLAAQPDLVLIRPMIDRGYSKLMKRLEQTGITVISLQPSTIEEMYVYWTCLGILTGKEQTAEAMINTFKQAVKAFREHAGTVKQPKRVYFEAMHKNMKTFSTGSMADFVLQTAGGINIARDATPSRGTNIAIYGKEKILSKADEIDVFLAQKGAMNHPSKALIRNEPGFSVIKAVKNNEIYIIDEQIVSRPTLRLLAGIHRTGILLYPEFSGTNWDLILKNLSMNAEHTKTNRTYYETKRD